MKKRLLATILVLCMVLGMLPGTAWAMDSDFTIEDGVLIKYMGSGGDVSIPCSVTSIGDFAFSGCTSLTGVTIPDSVVSIGSGAFSGSGLTNVTIPTSVTSIGSYAFYGCSSLPRITLPNSVTSIEKCVFSDCSSLTNVSIPNGVVSIGDRAFSGSGLTNVTIPNSVTSIGSEAFCYCRDLTSITIPSSVTDIRNNIGLGCSAFWGCSSLIAIQVDSKNQKYTSVDGILMSKDMKTLITYPNGKRDSYSIPSSVTSIEEFAFTHCANLTSVIIPNSVTSIGSCAFWNCTNLISVTIPNSVTSIGSQAFGECTNLTSIVIPGSITCIESSMFTDCTNLTNVTIPNGVTSIETSAFAKCFNLENVYYIGDETQWNEIKIGDTNYWLTSATIHYNSAEPDTPDTPDVPDTPGDDKDTYVDKLIGHSIASADADTKQTLHNAIINLLFNAQYRPTESRIPGDTMIYTGSLEVNKTWPIQNIHPYGNHVVDNVLGTIWFAESGAGCMSYALFATAYTYGTSGNRVECMDRSASGIKSFIQAYADPGEQLRYIGRKEGIHSIAFLGEDSGGDGFYYISYNGGARSGGGSHALFVGYHTYADFANNVSTSVLT